MITEIYIEKNLLDITQDLSMELNYAIDDVRDFGSRNTSFSRTIVVPGNSNNNKIFGHIFEMGSSNINNLEATNVNYNFNASKSASCIIYISKIQIFKGVIRLMQIILDKGTIEYECAVFGELGGFASSVGQKRIEDLDFSSYNHSWTPATIAASWNTVNGTGYFYPTIDYGLVSTDKIAYQIAAFRPALYVREYMDKIITDAGYTWESSFFDTTFFKRLVVPHNEKDLKYKSNILMTAGRGTPETIVIETLNYEAKVPFSSFTSTEFSANAQINTFTYTGLTPLTTNLTFNIYGSYENSDPDFDINLNVYKNGVLLVGSAMLLNYAVGTESYAWQGTMQLTFNTNDTIYFYYEQNILSDPFEVRVGDANVTIDTTNAVYSNVVLNGDVKVNDAIPKGYFQKDFFATILKMFNLYVTEDKLKEKHLIITPFPDFYILGALNYLQINDLEEELLHDDNFNLIIQDGQSNNFIDWSYKLDNDSALKVKPMSELNGRYYEYKYKQDNDWYNEQYQKKFNQSYGDLIHDTGFEFAKDKQSIEVIFSPTPLVSYVGKDKIVSTILKYTNNNTIEDRTEHNIRIMQVKKIACTSWNMLNGATTIGTFTNYGYAGHLDDPNTPSADINFGAPKEIYITAPAVYPSANLFNAFWSEYISEITSKDSKLLTCKMYLTSKDIFDVSFATLIYIEGTLWRLNKINNFNPNVPETTECEFLKVIDLIY